MATAEANPYILAVIGSGSALLGVAIATVTQIITARSVRRSQHELLSAQSAIAIQQALHAERRRAYADFLAAADKLDILITTMSSKKTTYTEITDQWWTVAAKTDPLRLLGPSAVVDATSDYMESLSDAMTAALSKESSPQLGSTKIYRKMIAAMQDALDISQSDRKPLPTIVAPPGAPDRAQAHN